MTNKLRIATLLILASIAIDMTARAQRIHGPLRQSPNPNYFEEAGGKAIVLCGSHSWNTFQDWGTDGAVQALDFSRFVSFLKSHGHNFTLLWTTELPRFHDLPVAEQSPPDFTVSPLPWQRTGPGTATDGCPKFDLTRFNDEYFDRLRSRVSELNEAGIYAGVYLFSGEWLLRFRCANDGYPFTGDNNINGIDDGYRGTFGAEAVASTTMKGQGDVTAFQDAYVRKTIDVLNDLPNVLWIVSEEAPPDSFWWNDHLIALIKDYEKTKPYQHLVGYGEVSVPNPQADDVLYNSDADWVAPLARISPVRSCGQGSPRCKVNVNDSDHSYFGMWNDTAQQNRNYIWENFINGNHVLFMDPYVVFYPRQQRNMCKDPRHGICPDVDARYENFRANLGYVVKYSSKLDLASVVARPKLTSTGFCLADTAAKASYLVYAPQGGRFTVDLSAVPAAAKVTVEWLNTETGKAVTGEAINGGSAVQSFQPPFAGDALLYLAAGNRRPGKK
jgi:hypothetical protein